MAKLTEQDQQEIIRFMEAGKPLPDKYRFLLFENKHERITLLNKQHAELEKQVVTLKQEVAMLKRENALIHKPGKTQDQIQEDLIHATFLCLKHSGGTTKLQQILDAISTTAHRRRIIKWVETFAPVSVRDSKIILNRSADIWRDRDFILSNFDKHLEVSGMANVKWYSIKTTKQRTWISIVSGGGGPGTGRRGRSMASKGR